MAWIRADDEPDTDGELREGYARVASARPGRQHPQDPQRVHDAACVAAYFNFVNRIALGLGVELEG